MEWYMIVLVVLGAVAALALLIGLIAWIVTWNAAAYGSERRVGELRAEFWKYVQRAGDERNALSKRIAAIEGKKAKSKRGA